MLFFRNAAPKERARHERGFTLIEVLIAITLLGMIVMMLFGGIRLGTRAWETSSDRTVENTSIEISHQIIRRLLSQAYPLADPTAISDFTGGRHIEFKGDPESVTFVGLFPAHLGGGFHRFELRVKNDGGDASLVLRWRRVSYEGDDDGATDNETILIERIAGANFTYFGVLEGGADPDWQAVWPDRTRLPALVRLAIVFPDGDRRSWPDLVVAPRIDTVAARIE